MTNNVLILCTHNSARSVLAEAMLNHWARRLGKDVQAFSAGSEPSGRVNPLAIDVLRAAGVDTTGCHSKSWDRFAAAAAPRMRIVITVCDDAAAQPCPVWPGAPVQVHWAYADPSQAPPAQRVQAFEATRLSLGERMRQLLELPLDEFDDIRLQQALRAIATA